MSSLQAYRGHQEVLSELEHHRTSPAKSETRISRFVVLGLFCLTLFVGGAAYWAHEARLDGAVFAEASLVVDGNRKTLQHLDGGIIRALLVEDGDAVVAGQTLLVLDGGEIAVTLDVLSGQVGDLIVRRARLLAQLNEAERFERADVASLTAGLGEEHWVNAFLTQQELFTTERHARLSEKKILLQRMTSLDEEIAGLQAQRESLARQSTIATSELEGLANLFAKGLVTGNRVNAVKAEIERLRGSDAALKTAQARAENEIGQLQLTGVSQQRLRAEAITTQLAGIEGRLAELGPQLSGALERSARIEIKAPVSGRIVNLAVFTTGGVVRPGQAILEIVPEGEELIVEARVRTTDIENLAIGQKARVSLTAFEQDEIPEAAGRIAQISADSLQDERTGEEFFVVKVALDEQQPSRVTSLELVPGMPVGLFVNTGERTALSYLTAPLRDRLQKTFIE